MVAVIVILATLANALAQSFNPGDTFSNCVNEISVRRRCNTNTEFRTIDGTCNNLRNPTFGAARTALQRFEDAVYEDDITRPRGFPTALDSRGTPIVEDENILPANFISRELFKVERQSRRTSDLTVLFMTFGQFVDHDMALSPHADCTATDCSRPDSYRYPCIPIRFQFNGRRCNPFARAIPVCRKSRRERRNQINDLTAFIDGSQIYGSELEFSERLRTNDGTGRLSVIRRNRNSHTGLLPFDPQIRPCPVRGGCSLVGDERGDENFALHSMHTLWVREHNRIADELRRINRRWDGDKIYETARKIVGAILQNILYNEWIPNIARLRRYYQYNQNVNPSIANVFSTAAFRFGHSLIPDQFSQLDRGFNPVRRKSSFSLQEAFLNRDNVNRDGIEPTMLGLVANKSNIVDNRFAFGIARRLFVPVGTSLREDEGIDLTAYNIERGRDHGLPTYGTWRSSCRLSVPTSFRDLERIMLPGTVEVFKRLYKSPSDIDLFAAGISERPANGLQVGPTFACIMRNQFQSLRDGDRFYFESRGVFTLRQVSEIKKSSMARVMCDNLRDIVSLQPNAFKLDNRFNNRRVSCDRIRKINLNEWKEY